MEKKPVQTATTVDLTEGCNLACDYCFTWSEHKAKKMSWKMLQNIIDWVGFLFSMSDRRWRGFSPLPT